MHRGLPALLLILGVALAEEPSVSGIVSTVRFHPGGEPARIGLSMLSRKGESGWKALRSLAQELADDHPRVARAAVRALAEGPEPERLRHAAALYSRLTDDRLRAILAHGLAHGFADHETLLLRHMRENRPGSSDVLRVLAPRVLPERELRRYLSIPDLAPIAYAALRERGLTVRAPELVTWARAIGRACLDPSVCRRWANEEPDFLLLEAVALAFAERDADEDERDGAHCLLLTVSGKRIQRDAMLWRSWIAARRDRYEHPAPGSPGEIAAAVVRGARFLRRDLLDDGRALWSADPGGKHAIGSTALAVLALLAAGTPNDHPAIEKALKETLVVFGPGGGPALRPLEHRNRETYVLSLLAMALCEVDAKRFRVPLDALRKRIVQGMQPSGAWGYRCLSPTDRRKPGRPDNSCTQYAVLALRALTRAGRDVPIEVWRKIALHFYRTRNGKGGWDYVPGRGEQVSMTSAGIGSLAICFEALHGRDAAPRIQADPVLEAARVYLGRLLMDSRLAREDLYALYGVERACVLTATSAFKSPRRSLDWHAAGARRLIGQQSADGSWGYPERRVIVGKSWGRAVDTSYAILFLQKATRTIGASEGVTIRVALPREQDKPDPPPPARGPPPVEKPRPPRLWVEWDHVPTRTGNALLAGVVELPATLTVDGARVEPDARGRFFVPLRIERNGTVAVVARGENGLEARREVTVAFDTDAPGVRLLGPPQRHVGTQVLVFRANEPLKALRVAGRVYPADGPVVRAAVEVGEGKRTLTVIATDRAGNEGRAQFDVEAKNRVLVLDGQSALGFDLREVPPRFTVECWVRGGDPNHAGSVIANTESSGFALVWASRHHNFPHGIVRIGRNYLAVGPKRPWKWGAWTHLAFTYDGATGRFFVNGRLHGEHEGAPHHGSHRRLYVGAEPNRHNHANDFFKGEVDEVRVSRVARYEKDFRPERHFMRDRATLLLLHFERDTLADRLVIDDSGRLCHGVPHGAPRIEAPGESVLPFVRDELRRELPPVERVVLSPAQRAEQDERAHAEATARLGLVEVAVRVVTPSGQPFAGLAVRGLHESFDLSDGPATTDARGEARLRLPRGPWRVDVATRDPKPGRVVFARARFVVRGPGREDVALDRKRVVRFRTRAGELRTAQAVTLAWPDFSFHRRVDASQVAFEILTHGDAPMVVQAVRRPDDSGPGYVVRKTVGPGDTTIETDPEQATEHRFRGRGARRLAVRYASADALPIDLSFASKERRTVVLSGLGDVVLGLDVTWGRRSHGFYPRPFLVDGKPREFRGVPRFEASVGFVRNWRPQYNEKINSISLRVFLTTPSGLLLKGDDRGAYSIEWEQVLDGSVRASGTTRSARPIWTPPLDPKLVPKLRYRLLIRGPGENRRVEVAGHEQTAVVHEGKVRTWAFPAVAANARHWAKCVSRAVRAYEETCPFRHGRVDVERSIHMPLPIIGMGGSNGWMWLPEGSVYGFYGTWYWTGLLSHELGHVFRYGHSNPLQSRIMRQAGRRAGRRLWSIRPGMARIPEGNRFRALLEAVTRGELSLDTPLDDDTDVALMSEEYRADPAGDGVLVPNLELTGDDQVFWWAYRSMFGPKVDEARRKHAASWSWWLTLRGFDDEEIQIAMLSRAAGTSLAWLARMRGILVHDHRIAAAVKALDAADAKFVFLKERQAIRHRWRTRRYGPGDDLAEQERLMRAELGHRYDRVWALLRIARAWFLRREPAKGEAAVRAALVEARRGGPEMLEGALGDAAPFWLGR